MIKYNRFTEDRREVARKLQETNSDISIIHPCNHPHVIAGGGTVAMELFQEVGHLDALFCCLGGGGLISGCALAVKALSPACKIYGVEPEEANKSQLSVEAGVITATAPSSTIAEGANNTFIGDMCFKMIQDYVDHLIDVSDR